MLSLQLLVTGGIKNSEKYFSDAAAEFEKRLGAYCRFTTLEFDDTPSVSSKLLAALRPRAYKIALCVEGKQLSSEELAEKLGSVALSGVSQIDFVIGGSEGLSESVKAACDLRLSFSRMTFPHRLMRVILLEQIYRAFTIMNGEKYHK
ncbi:MAG: 23S rRNA (pseudouridine(1915)-N(3))-methyltransferase RlmH [Eubacteriales bacterium]